VRTLNRQCSSGLQACADVASAIKVRAMPVLRCAPAFRVRGRAPPAAYAALSHA